MTSPTPRACAKAALQGCAALLAPGSAAAPVLAARPELAVEMGRALAEGVQLPSLTVSGRQLGLQAWLALLQVGWRRLHNCRLQLALRCQPPACSC